MTIAIRAMSLRDLPLGMRLKEQAGWNQTRADWLRFLALEPEGCFVAELEGRPVGTTVTTVLGSVGWIAMVLVERSVRGQGIGTGLVEHAIGHLESRPVRTIRLDATPLGRPLYEKLGLVPEYDLTRWEGLAPALATDPRVQPVSGDLLPEIVELDCRATGTDRARLIGQLHSQWPEAMRVVCLPSGLAGYATFRPGSLAAQIGPAVATGPEAGVALGDAMLQSCVGRRVFIDVPADNAPATAWAKSRGLTPQRQLTRMRRGQPVHDFPSLLWASSGPENG